MSEFSTSGAPLRLAVILGSVREGRFGPTVTEWFAEQARQHGAFEVDLIDLADFPLPTVLGEPSPETAALLAEVSPRLAAADAFVVVTPEYNHSFPSSIKNLIDWHSTQWQAKPVGFVSYGGMAGGLRSVEQLRQVFPEMHALTVRDSLSFHNAWNLFDEDGQPKDREGTSTAAKGLLNQVEWWATALRTARAERPYQP